MAAAGNSCNATPAVESTHPVSAPVWLPTLLSTPFYRTCPAHAHLRRADLNLFDTETCNTLCQHCVAANPALHRRQHPHNEKDLAKHTRPMSSHPSVGGGARVANSPPISTTLALGQTVNTPVPRLLHISRYMYHAVALLREASLHLDVSHIQPYLNNGHRVLYLDRSRQPKSRLAPNAASCTVCSRTLQHPYLYCSLRCKLNPTSSHSNPPTNVDPVNLSSTRPPSSSSKNTGPNPKSRLAAAIRTMHQENNHSSKGNVSKSTIPCHGHGPITPPPQSPPTTAPGTPRCHTPSDMSSAPSPASPAPILGGRKRDRERAARRAAAERKKAAAVAAAAVGAISHERAPTISAGVPAPLATQSNGIAKKSRSKRKSRPVHSPAAGPKTFFLMRSALQPLLL